MTIRSSRPALLSKLPVGLGAVALVLAAGMTLAIAGCSREGATSKAVKRGARDLHSVSGGAAAAPPSEVQTTKYKAITDGVNSVADKGRAGDNSAANLLLARSQSGSGESALTAEYAAEREAMNSLTVLRAQLRSFIDRSIIATSAGSFDPTARIAELGQSASKLGTQIATSKAAKAELDAKIADLRAKAQAKLDEAQPHQVAYADLRQQASTQTATQGEPLIKQANERKRSGDKLRNEADWLSAQADQVVPQSTEAGVNISKLETLKAGLEGESAALATQAAASKQQASEARAAATVAADDLIKSLDTLEAFRAGPLTKAGDEAIRAFTTALASAKKAQSDSASLSRLNVGELQQSIGDVHFSRAIGLRLHATFLNDVATANPPFPDASKYADAAKAASDAKAKEIEAAKAAYEAAKAAYEGSGSRGETKERMQHVGEVLGKLSEFIDGKDADFGTLTATPKAAPAEATAAATTTTAVPAGDPKAAVVATMTALLADAKAGRFDKLADATAAGTGANSKVSDGVRLQLVALGKLDAASRSKFGKGLLEGAPNNQLMAGVKANLAPLASVDPTKVDVKIEGDLATVTGGGLPKAVTFRNQGGKWKQEADMSEIPPQMQEIMVTAGEMMGKFADEAVAGIQSGSLQSPDAALNDVAMKLQMALMQQMQKKQGGG